MFPEKLGDLVQGPVDEAWALHRAHIHAGRFLLLEGLDPREVVPVPTWDELDRALASEAAFALAHPEHPEFALLQACRITYSRHSHDVVLSKWDAARWGVEAMPSLQPAIEAAVRSYTDATEPGDDVLLAGAWPAVEGLLNR